jgi:dihydrofolate synthase/folylpolyglutamate synthase
VTYAEAIQFLYGLQMFGANLGLERTHKLAALAGKPQEQLRFIHVAGTNGKGSTCAMLESIYRAAGLRVGLFTSPHLVSFRERIQINRQLISQADVARLAEQLQSMCLESRLQTESAKAGTPSKQQEHPTMFEVVTVMALKYFAEQKCDIVIWETGLGGRLDATNIVSPLASVITNIALDHTEWLGDTLEKIAAEKAGIIKPSIPVITTEAKPEALSVIASEAKEKNAPLVVAQGRLAGTLAPPLFGDHQKINAALALAVVEVLQKQIPISPSQIESGLQNINWPGRLQLVERPGGQKILLDGAHNLAGAETLCAILENWGSGFSVPPDKLKLEPRQTLPTLIFGALADKNWPAICQMLAPLADKIIVTPVASKRTADPADLATTFRQANPQAAVNTAGNLAEALFACKDEPFVVITGSLYLVGEALERLEIMPSDAAGRALNEWSPPGQLDKFQTS